jgi:predicted transcriptional regulator
VTDQASRPSASPNYIELAADIVSAFVSKNAVPVSELPALIANVHGALRNVGSPAPKAEEIKLTPAVPVKKSITADAIISLEDGKPYKSMKRHLSRLGLTPEQYRTKWGLPSDYPMVAPSYAAKRSELAKSLGLGLMRKKPAQAKAAATTAKKTASDTPKKRGPKKEG